MPAVGTRREGERDGDKKRSNGDITITAAQGDQAMTDLHKARDRETSIPFPVTTAMPSQRSTRPPPEKQTRQQTKNESG
jgi:hypothetical protein